MLKLLYKVISVVLTTAVVYISCCPASDSGVMIGKEPAYIPPPAEQKAPKRIVIKKAPKIVEKPHPPQPSPTPAPKATVEKFEPQIPQPQAKETPEITEQEPAAPITPQGEKTQPESQKQPPLEPKRDFGGLLLKMLVALCKSIAIILAAAGAYFIYKKAMAKKSAPKTPGGDTEEPKTIGEAVSSYIKHRLRK